MMDLRQIHHNQMALASETPMDLRTKLKMKQRSIDGGLHERNFSMENIDRRTAAFGNHIPPGQLHIHY